MGPSVSVAALNMRRSGTEHWAMLRCRQPGLLLYGGRLWTAYTASDSSISAGLLYCYPLAHLLSSHHIDKHLWGMIYSAS